MFVSSLSITAIQLSRLKNSSALLEFGVELSVISQVTAPPVAGRELFILYITLYTYMCKYV